MSIGQAEDTSLSAKQRGKPGLLLEVIAVFLKLGFTAFGGPAAHIALFRHEVVERRKWVTDEQFLDLLGATNLIPGPNSTEMTIHLGYVRAGWPGLIAGGICFTLPAMLIVLGISWLYVHYQSTPQFGWLLYGVKPVIIAIIIQALWMLGKKALNNWLAVMVGTGAAVLYFLHADTLALLLAGGMLVMLARNRKRLKLPGKSDLRSFLLPSLGAGIMAASAAVPFSLPVLFLSFLKIGAVLYGSGYVLVAFLRADFVSRLGWLTEQQLLDAIAIGQITPGPLFTSATFIGFLVGGLPGAVLATIGIFLPSYVFVALSNPLIPRIRSSPWAGALLDGVIAASLGLMAAVSLQLGQAALIDLPSILIFLVSAFILLRWRPNATWLIAAGALVGWLMYLSGHY